MDILVTIHSVWRYAVLIAAIIAILAALGGGLGWISARPTTRRAGLLYVIVIDIQVLIGIALWVGQGWYARPGFFRAEHPVIMVLALIAAHVGQALSRRAKTPEGAARTVLVAVIVSLVLVLVGIPGIVRGG